MKFQVDQGKLQKALSIVGKAVSRRSTVPILANMLLETDGGMLCITASDREITIRLWIEAKIKSEGSTTIPGRILTDFVASLPPGEIAVAVNEKDVSKFSSGTINGTINGLPAFDYPLFSSTDLRWHSEIPTDGLGISLAQVTVSASNDESRPALMGVEVVFDGLTLQMASTDGYRMSRRVFALGKSVPEKLSVIVPHSSLDHLSKMLGDAKGGGWLEVGSTENQIIFSFEGKNDRSGFVRAELRSLLSDGKYPDWRSTVPKEFTRRAKVRTEDLVKSLKVSLIYSRDSTNIVGLSFNPISDGASGGFLRLTSASSELGNSISDIDADIKGDALDINFNARYLLEALGHIGDEYLIIECSQPTRPGLFYPAFGEKEDFFYLCMPMHPPRD